MMNSIEGLEPGTSLATAIGERINSNETVQPISSIRSNTDSERQSLNDLENMKYKTELCRNYSAYGYCSYSSRCQFAHGFEELRCRSRHPKYKTEFCRNFISGFCKYGSRCQFLHKPNNTHETSSSHDLLTPPPPLPTVPHSTAAAIGTYLLTNMLAHSTAFGLGESLAALATYANIPVKPTPTESSLKQRAFPYTCGIEMHQVSPLHLSSHLSHGIFLPQNQNNNDSQQSLLGSGLL